MIFANALAQIKAGVKQFPLSIGFTSRRGLKLFFYVNDIFTNYDQLFFLEYPGNHLYNFDYFLFYIFVRLYCIH